MRLIDCELRRIEPMKTLGTIGLASIALGAALLFASGFVWRPQKILVSGGVGIANADFEEQSNDRIIAAIAGGALFVGGAVMWSLASLEVTGRTKRDETDR